MKYTLNMDEICQLCAEHIARKIGSYGTFEISMFGRSQNGKVIDITVEIEETEKQNDRPDKHD